MRCFVTGATGLVGGRLIEGLVADGHAVVGLSRRPPREGKGGIEWVVGDPTRQGDWQRAVDGCDAVVHLAGESIAGQRWNAEVKRRLVSSRVDAARRLAQAIRRAERPPSVLVSASAVGYYGPRGDEALPEDAAPGDDFLARLCVDWEAAARESESDSTRVVCLRIGIVLAREGGALEKMLPPFRLGLGGPIGPSGRWFPWVHLDDVVGLIRMAIDRPLSGAVNAVSPQPATMGEFARALGRALHRPAWIPVPLAPLRIALGEFAEHLSPGQKVVPSAALDAGYAFRFPSLDDALRDCVG